MREIAPLRHGAGLFLAWAEFNIWLKSSEEQASLIVSHEEKNKLGILFWGLTICKQLVSSSSFEV